MDLLIQLLIDDNEKIYLYGETYVIDKLPVPIILGMNFLESNYMDIVIDGLKGTPAIRIQNHYVLLQTKAKNGFYKKSARYIKDYKCRVMADRDIIIQPGFG
jgi:hypothetical protein